MLDPALLVPGSAAQDGALVVVALALLAAAFVAQAATLRAWVSRDRAFLVGLLVLVLGLGSAGVALVPKAPWAMNQHGIELWAVVRSPPLFDGHERDHGAAHLVLGSLLGWGLPAAVRPWGASVVQGLLAACVLGCWVRMASGQRRAGLAAAMLLTVAPWHLRLLPSLSGYVTAELGMVLGVLGTHLTLRSGSARDALLLAGGWLLAVQARADAAVLAPVIFAAAALPERGVQRPLTRAARRVVALAAACWALRVVGALTGQSPEPAPWQVEHLRALALVGGALGLLVAVAPRRLPAVVALGAGVAGLRAAAALAPWDFKGIWWQPAEPLYGILRVWPQLHPWISSPVATALAIVGLALVAGRSRAAAGFIVAGQLLVSALHFVVVGEDGVSFYVRVVAVTGWAWMGLAGLAWARAVEVFRRVPLGVHVASMALVGGSVLVTSHDLLGHVFATQAEAQVLFDHALVPGGPVVVALSRRDVGVRAEALTPPWPLDLAAQSEAVGGPRVVGVGEALAHPEAVVGGVWWRGLDCVRVGEVRPAALGVEPAGAAWVVGDGRVWRQPPQPVRPDPPARPASPPWMRLEDLPCLAVPEAAVCAQEVEGACRVWSCPTGVVLPRGARYEDPACHAFEEAFVLEPLREVRAVGGSLDSDRLQPLDPYPLVGAYRIVAGRKPQDEP